MNNWHDTNPIQGAWSEAIENLPDAAKTKIRECSHSGQNLAFQLFAYAWNESASRCAAEREAPPWRRMDDGAPKDAAILGIVNGRVRIIRWGKASHVPIYGWCLADQCIENFDICRPLWWMEMPRPPV